MDGDKLDIFLSVGSTHNDEQETLVQSIETFLEFNGLNAQTVGRTYFANQQPLKSVEELMHKCSGIIVLALERTHINAAVEKQNSPNEKELENLKLPSVWNQIEAAIAYAMGLPILVLAEHGIKSEGLIEAGYDWYVKWFSLEQELLKDAEFSGVFNSWKSSVLAYKESKKNDNSKSQLRIGSPKHLTQLRQILSERFSDDELRTFVFDLGEDYESLPGNSKTVKAMELVAKMNRYNKLQALIDMGKQARDDVSWV